MSKVNELYDDISSYHDIVSDLRDMLREVKKYPILKENDTLMCFGSIIDDFEGYIFKSMDKIDKLRGERKWT